MKMGILINVPFIIPTMGYSTPDFMGIMKPQELTIDILTKQPVECDGGIFRGSGVSQGKPISDDWKLTMFVGSYTLFVVGFAKLFSMPNMNR